MPLMSLDLATVSIYLLWAVHLIVILRGCPPVRGDNPRALASGLPYEQVDTHSRTILYLLHKCRHYKYITRYFVLKLVRVSCEFEINFHQ